ncbi:unnamed protein product [Lactuca virosa]|uniref:Cyclic nucleotide-binding domain-containing protein n=1 Tax=Lactuca virosa TaxID=75947 RepID=A0AAU9P2P5_9ASTR|nr:unnamed protein product [Lactuca virosa]
MPTENILPTTSIAERGYSLLVQQPVNSSILPLHRCSEPKSPCLQMISPWRSVCIDQGINAPTSRSLANYVMLSIVYGGILIYRESGLKAKWYYYLLLGLVDVEANYLESGSSPIKGDFLVVAGATLYAVSNVSEEFFVKIDDIIELMDMLGLFS